MAINHRCSLPNNPEQRCSQYFFIISRFIKHYVGTRFVITENVRLAAMTQCWRHPHNCSIKVRLFLRTALPIVTEQRCANCAVRNEILYITGCHCSLLLKGRAAAQTARGVTCGLWWTQWHLDKASSANLCLQLSAPFHQRYIFIFYPHVPHFLTD